MPPPGIAELAYAATCFPCGVSLYLNLIPVRRSSGKEVVILAMSPAPPVGETQTGRSFAYSGAVLLLEDASFWVSLVFVP
jgi:hypothetical protein